MESLRSDIEFLRQWLEGKDDFKATKDCLTLGEIRSLPFLSYERFKHIQKCFFCKQSLKGLVNLEREVISSAFLVKLYGVSVEEIDQAIEWVHEQLMEYKKGYSAESSPKMRPNPPKTGTGANLPKKVIAGLEELATLRLEQSLLARLSMAPGGGRQVLADTHRLMGWFAIGEALGEE